MTLMVGVHLLLPQKFKNSSNKSAKTTTGTLKAHDVNRERFNMSRYI